MQKRLLADIDPFHHGRENIPAHLKFRQGANPGGERREGGYRIAMSCGEGRSGKRKEAGRKEEEGETQSIGKEHEDVQRWAEQASDADSSSSRRRHLSWLPGLRELERKAPSYSGGIFPTLKINYALII